MPLLSLIIPIYNVQPYLQECLDSVLSQEFSDLEVVAVDDCSPDHSGDIADQAAARDARIRVLHLEQNVGLGPARNIGLRHATGEYVMFLDSDDSLTAGALQQIAHTLESSGHPDLLLLDHARTYWWGAVARNIRHDVLEELAGKVFTAEGHPEIFQLLHVAWNKVSRRQFLEREGLSFPSGYYEDTPWTYQAVLTAESIAALPYVCVLYRQRRHGSILGTRSDRHFEVFDQWARVFGFLDTRPDLSHWRPIISERMAGHHLTVLRKPSRLTDADQSEYFRRASAQLVMYGSEIEPDPTRSATDRVLHRLLYRGDPRLFHAMKRANSLQQLVAKEAKSTVRKGKRLRRRAKTAIKLSEYHRLQDRPLDESLAVFASLWNRGVVGNPKAIYDAMGKHAPQIHGTWVIRESERDRVPKGVDYIVPGSRRYWQTMARAKYFVNDVNFADEVVKRRGQVHVQTQHGTPLKHMGLELMQHPAASKGMNFNKLLKRSDRWDYNISSNRFSTLIWERAFPSAFTTLEAGYPRNDILVNAGAADVQQARADLGIPGTKTAVLYAPTHRDHDKHFIMRADLARLAADLGDDFLILVRAHYFYKWMPEVAEMEKRGLVMNVSQHQDVEQVMLASDLLVTDYSSIMFDFANLNRPIVIYAPDWDTYRDVRGVYFDLMAQAPGAFTQSQEELTKVLSSGHWEAPECLTQLSDFRRRFCEFDDGRAGERIVRNVFLGEPLLPIASPDERPVAPRPRDVHLVDMPEADFTGAPEEGHSDPSSLSDESEAQLEAEVNEEVVAD